MNLPKDAERVLCELTDDERRQVLALLAELFPEHSPSTDTNQQ